jgi:hypothetical protein
MPDCLRTVAENRLTEKRSWTGGSHVVQQSFPPLSALHFSAFDLFASFSFFRLSPRNHVSGLSVSRKKEKKTKKRDDPILTFCGSAPGHPRNGALPTAIAYPAAPGRPRPSFTTPFFCFTFFCLPKMSDCLRTVLANRLTEKNKPHWGQACSSAIVHHPLFLPSIFLPLIFSSLFPFFGYHREITCRVFRLAQKRKRKRKNATNLFLLFAVLLPATHETARSRPRLLSPTRWHVRGHFVPPHFSALHFSAFDFSPLFPFFGYHRKITYRFLRLAEKRKRKRKKVIDLFLLFRHNLQQRASRGSPSMARVDSDHPTLSFSRPRGETAKKRTQGRQGGWVKSLRGPVGQALSPRGACAPQLQTQTVRITRNACLCVAGRQAAAPASPLPCANSRSSSQRPLLVGRAYPTHPVGRNDDQPVTEIRLRSVPKQRHQQRCDVLSRRWMGLDADYAAMFREREHDPVTKVLVQRDEDSALAHGPVEYQPVVGAGLSNFRGADHVMAVRPQEICKFRPQHLVQVEAHNGSGRFQRTEFSVQHSVTGVIQDRLDVRTLQLGIAAQYGIPRFAGGQLLQNCRHRNPRAFDHRLPAANARVNLNSPIHGTIYYISVLNPASCRPHPNRVAPCILY